MARFYERQRVVLVRGVDGVSDAKEKGAIGTFVRYEYWPIGFVFCDGSINETESDCIVVWDGYYGEHAQGSNHLEPLISTHQACDDAEFIASLDKLAQRVGEVA